MANVTFQVYEIKDATFDDIKCLDEKDLILMFEILYDFEAKKLTMQGSLIQFKIK